MAESKLSYPHGQKTQGIALEKTKKILGEAKKQHANQITDLKEDWKNNTCEFSFKAKVKGISLTISGTLTVEEKLLKLTVKYPDTAAPFKSKVESILMDVAKDTFK